MPREYKNFEEWWKLEGQYESPSCEYENLKAIWETAYKAGDSKGYERGYDFGREEADTEAAEKAYADAS